MAASLLPDYTLYFFSLPFPLHFFFGAFLAYLPFVFPLSNYNYKIIVCIVSFIKLQTNTFTYRIDYKQTLLLYTEAFTHGRFYIQNFYA